MWDKRKPEKGRAHERRWTILRRCVSLFIIHLSRISICFILSTRSTSLINFYYLLSALLSIYLSTLCTRSTSPSFYLSPLCTHSLLNQRLRPSFPAGTNIPKDWSNSCRKKEPTKTKAAQLSGRGARLPHGQRKNIIGRAAERPPATRSRPPHYAQPRHAANATANRRTNFSSPAAAAASGAAGEPRSTATNSSLGTELPATTGEPCLHGQ